jgi:PEP-CTERM motif
MSARLANASAAVAITIAWLGCAESANAQITYLNDSFNTFAAGNLVGQNAWTQLGAVATVPLQVTAGQVVIPASQTADNQDAWKNTNATDLSLTGTTSYFYGVRGSISNAPVVPGTFASSSYFAAMYTSQNAGGFANYRLTAIDNGAGTYVLGVRITGQAGDPFTFGTTGLAYNTSHVIIGELQPNALGGILFNLYVDPTSPNLASQTPYVVNTIGTGTPPISIGSFVFSQFASATVGNVGGAFDQTVVTDNFAGAYNLLQVPEPTSLALTGLGLGAVWLRRRQNAQAMA